MTVLHTGSTKKYSANWGDIFGKGSAKPAKTDALAKSQASDGAKPAKKSAPKAKAAKAKPAKKAKGKK